MPEAWLRGGCERTVQVPTWGGAPLLSSGHVLLSQVAWLHGLMDFVFPYLIQFLRQYSTSVDLLMADRKVRGSQDHHCRRCLSHCGMGLLVICCPSAGWLGLSSPEHVLQEMLEARKAADEANKANAAQNNAHLGLAPLMLTQGPGHPAGPPGIAAAVLPDLQAQ